MGGPENFKGFDYQISYSIFRILDLMINNKDEVDSIKFESIDENEEDFNIYWRNGNIEYVQIKKRDEGYSWTPSNIKKLISNYYKKYSSKTYYRFVTNAPANLDVKQFKTKINNNELPSNSILTKFRPSLIANDKFFELILTINIETLYHPSDNEEDPAKRLKQDILSILNGPNFYVSNNIEKLYNNLWKYIYDKSKTSSKIKFSKIEKVIFDLGAKLLESREWIRLPEISSLSGREKEINNILNQSGIKQKICIKGISGIGKTFITAKVAQILDKRNKKICWFGFNVLQDKKEIITIISKFMENSGAIDASYQLGNSQDETNQVMIIVNFIKQYDIHFFIDSYEKANPNSKHFINEIFYSLNNSDNQGCILITATNSNDLYTKEDVKIGAVFESNIFEFSEEDFKLHFKSVSNKINDSKVSKLYDIIGGFPITAVFMKQLIADGFLEQNSFKELTELSLDKRNKWIFDKVYSNFHPNIQLLISDLSIMNYSFTEVQVEALNYSSALNYKYELFKLAELSILVFNGESFYMHDSVRLLAYDTLSDLKKINSHNLLKKLYEKKLFINDISVPKNIRLWGYHTESIFKLDNSFDLGINKKIFKCTDQVLADLWGISNCGYPFEYEDETLLSTERRINELIRNKFIKKRTWLSYVINTIKRVSILNRFKYRLYGFTEQDDLILEYLILEKGISNYMGYIIMFQPNLSYINQAATICAWEHCIEYMPLENGELSCPIFGHNCPSGLAQVKICNENEEI